MIYTCIVPLHKFKKKKSFFLKQFIWVGTMNQRLRALAALLGGLSLVPSAPASRLTETEAKPQSDHEAELQKLKAAIQRFGGLPHREE